MFSSVKILLSSIIDYAGLFPPAKLNLQDAIANYNKYQQTPDNFLLGRFVIPAARLTEFLTVLKHDALENQIINPWLLSVILSDNWELELQQIKTVNNNNQVKITAVEFKPLTLEEISRAIIQIPPEIEFFLEIPLNENIETYLIMLQGKQVSAKIRTGGLTVEAFPSVEQLCQFIFASAKAQIPFKATAGLHHLLPGKYPLTGKPHSLWATMQGFLNLSILAALVYWQKIAKEQAVILLQESSLNNFQFTEDHITWKDCHLTCLELEKARQYFFRSFGSCSFQEPLNELVELQLL